MGGDCLNMGCVPSKALISAARVAASARHAADLGVHVGSVDVDFAAVMERMRRLRARLAPIDGVERFTTLGVDVYLGAARFTGPTTVLVDGRTLEFSRAIVATGARAAAPPIPGLEEAGYLTNETVFWLTDLPRRLVVIGAGPIGCELAQTFRSFGSDVTVIHMDAHVLPRDDADAAAIVERRLTADGVRLVHGATIGRVARRGADVAVTLGGGRRDRGGRRRPHPGRPSAARPTSRTWGSRRPGCAATPPASSSTIISARPTPRIYAAGDVASRFQFTHVADALARIVDPERALRHLRPEEGERAHGTLVYLHHAGGRARRPVATRCGGSRHRRSRPSRCRCTTWIARCSTATRRASSACTCARAADKIVGATLVAARAGDMISELTLAMAAGAGLGTIAGAIHPYPTQAEVMKKAADAYNRTRLTPLVKKVFAWWLARHR